MRTVAEGCRPSWKRGQYRIVIPAALCMAGILAAPGAALSSAREGLDLFMTVVLPSLLPFFILTRLLLETPVVEDAGRLLEPVMRPLFGCPGRVAFAMTVSFLSGYPAGSRVVARLYEQGRLRDGELRRAACLCSTSGPVFLLGAVGAGMFGSGRTGWLILLGHYLAVVLTGILLGGFRGREPAEKSAPAPPDPSRPLGAMLADAVRGGAASITLVGGFVILFSVLTGLAVHFRLADAAGLLLSAPLRWLGLPEELSVPFFAGFLELTAGCRQAALAGESSPVLWAAACAVVTWGGLSAQAQSMAFLSGTPLSAGRFSAVKALQAALSFGLCLLLSRLPFFAAGSVPCYAGGLSAAAAVASSLLLLAGAVCATIAPALLRRLLRGSAR